MYNIGDKVTYEKLGQTRECVVLARKFNRYKKISKYLLKNVHNDFKWLITCDELHELTRKTKEDNFRKAVEDIHRAKPKLFQAPMRMGKSWPDKKTKQRRLNDTM